MVILLDTSPIVNMSNCVIIIVTESGIVASKIVLPKGGDMTRASIREHSEAVRWRYFQAPKKEKTKILDEFSVKRRRLYHTAICDLAR